MNPAPALNLDLLISDVHAAFRAWHTIGGTAENLLEHLVVVQERRKKVAPFSSPSMLRLATNQVLLEAIEELATSKKRRARLLMARFPDKKTLRSVAAEFYLSEEQVSRIQRAGIESVAKILLARELAAREARIQSTEAGLQPATYDLLFGLESERERLLSQLLEPQAPWVIALVGIGGIGKTALADAVIRQVIRESRFEKVVWQRVEATAEEGATRPPGFVFERLAGALAERLWPQSADRESLSGRLNRLRRTLKAEPHLIVIDNLEDRAESAFLLSQIVDLAEPSKFLLTSRTRVPVEAGVYTYLLDELPADDALALLQHQGRSHGVEVLGQTTADGRQALYRALGGNPLALKLVASLASVMSLTELLDGLAGRPLAKTEALFDKVFGRAWQTLSADARQALLSMLVFSELGALQEQVRAVSGLDEAALWASISELAARSLLEVRGSAWQRRYGIHRLTESFLQGQIVPQEYGRYVSFVRSNLVYWRSAMGEVDSQAIDHSYAERQNLLRAVRQGVSVPETRSEGAALLSQAFTIIERSGNWREWIPVFDDAIQQPDERPDERLLGRLQNQKGFLQRLVNDRQAAVSSHEAALKLAEEAGDELLLAETSFNLCEDFRQLRVYETAERHGRRALAIFERQEASINWQAATRNALGLIAQDKGELETAEALMRRAVALWGSTGQQVELARSLNNLGIILGQAGKSEEALQAYRQAAELLEETPWEREKAMVRISLGTLYAGLGRYSDAEDSFRQVDVAGLARAGYAYYQALAEQNLGIVLLEQKRYREAELHLRRSIDLWRDIDDKLVLANALGALAELLSTTHEGRAARPIYDEAIELLQGYPDNAFAQRVMADLLEQQRKLGKKQAG